MEEARQHPALTAEQRLVATIYHLGSVALIVSICLQVFSRVDALYPTILVVGASRIGLAAWQTIRPECSSTERTPTGLVGTIVVWTCTIAILIWARLYGAGT